MFLTVWHCILHFTKAVGKKPRKKQALKITYFFTFTLNIKMRLVAFQAGKGQS